METQLDATMAAKELFEEKTFTLRRILVAYDGSASSDRAVQDAAILAARHRAEVLIIHVDVPSSVAPEPLASSIEPKMAKVSEELASQGVRHRGIQRRGSVGEMILTVCGEESADLLMIGAYGHGRVDRETLGSTAEQLLRSMPCPVLTYGPATAHSMLSPERTGPALFPIALPCNDAQIPGAIGLARLFHANVEVFYAVPSTKHCDIQWAERECLRTTSIFRLHGIHASWSFLYGSPDLVIWTEADELRSPWILMPLKWKASLSSRTSDNIAARVIRHATVPVLTYRFN